MNAQMLIKSILAAGLGIGGLAVVGIYTSWEVPLAIFLASWGSNLAQSVAQDRRNLQERASLEKFKAQVAPPNREMRRRK